MEHIYKLAKKFEKKLSKKSRPAKQMNRNQLIVHLEQLSDQHSLYRKALQKANADLKKAQEDLDYATEMAESTRQEMEKYHKILENLNLTGGTKVVHKKDIVSYLTDEGDMVMDGSEMVPYKSWKKKLKEVSIPHEHSEDDADCGACDCEDCSTMKMI